MTMSKQDILRKHKEYLFPSQSVYFADPLVTDHASMQYLWDSEGKKYLDFFGGIVTISVGHANPKVTSKIKAQIDKLQRASTLFPNEAIVALAEKLSIPVATSLNGKDSIPGLHPLSIGVSGTYSRESANRVIGQADLVCFIGTETGGMTTNFWTVPKIGVAAIQIDIEPECLGRNYPLKAAVLGDAKIVLARMLEHADGKTAAKRKAWLEKSRLICKEWYSKYQPMLQSDAVVAMARRSVPAQRRRAAPGRDGHRSGR